jgi:hypothetical protein
VTALFLVGDIRDRQAELIVAGETFDLIICSPPFYGLRSYLPDDHPDKPLEIGSEGGAAEFMDTLLELTADWGRLLAPHGSIAIELGDTYAGSGGAGGDYNPDGLRDGQPKFRVAERIDDALAKSLYGIPQAYMLSLIYGWNVLRRNAADSPAGRWRVRNLKPWIRSNPPVGALGDKERPATSYVVVACRARDRWFDLDAVRTTPSSRPQRRFSNEWGQRGGDEKAIKYGDNYLSDESSQFSNAAGAPPRDWFHTVDAILDTELAERAGQRSSNHEAGEDIASPGRLGSGDGTNNGGKGKSTAGGFTVGAQGMHLRRALERAGILQTQEALDVSPRGYSGAHYAVWPPELVRLLVDEMCPRKVCLTCGEPSRRITERSERYAAAREAIGDFNQRSNGQGTSGSRSVLSKAAGANITSAENITVGWSDCGHNTWRPGRILDPFVGSGTTLAVATGMGRDATGIDIDERNAWLARERVGLFLTVDMPDREVPA